MSQVSSGFLSHGIPYLAVGEGPPLVKVEGLTPTHEVPDRVDAADVPFDCHAVEW